jgi:thiol-disulfide isomerase/thioredoxin
MTAKRLSIATATLAIAVVLVLGLLQLGGGSTSTTAPSKLTLAQMRAALSGSPAPLAALHEQAGEILAGGLPALRARLAALRGRPIVINKWASWCEPCREEFGALQRVSISQGRRVAFIGIDTEDSRSGALAFLRAYPLSYPSYYDHSGQTGRAVTGSSFTPVTVFYDRSGSEYVRQGPYPTAAKLEQDVERYALDG